MVAPDSLSHMVAAMVNDITVMGLCGETRIANRTDSWVTMIQGMSSSGMLTHLAQQRLTNSIFPSV
jgi:cellulose synthase/poly-beta-1,6-N-acetylglucosamine synthase-like glycosyltransferase